MKTPTIILLSCFGLSFVVPADQELTSTVANGGDRRGGLASELVAARLLAKSDLKKPDYVEETWAYLTLKMPDLALTALAKARGQMTPAIAPIFEAEAAALQSTRNRTAGEILSACQSNAGKSNELMRTFIGESGKICNGRLWTNATPSEASDFYGTGGSLPVCEVRIPLRLIADACSRNAFEEIAQTLQLLSEISRLSLVVVVVDLTDAPGMNQIEVRCLGAQITERTSTGYSERMVALASHQFSIQPSLERTGQSQKGVEESLEGIMLRLCTEAVQFTFGDERIPPK